MIRTVSIRDCKNKEGNIGHYGDIVDRVFLKGSKLLDKVRHGGKVGNWKRTDKTAQSNDAHYMFVLIHPSSKIERKQVKQLQENRKSKGKKEKRMNLNLHNTT